VRRPGRDALEVLLAHTTRYDDWTFPKGKVRNRERDEESVEWLSVADARTRLSHERDRDVLDAVGA
jgi:hypothetical protein